MSPPLRLKYNAKLKQWWFVLLAKNGKVLMHSEMYTTKRGAEKGMNATRRALLGV